MDIHEYFCKVFRYHKENPGQRIGQAYMNVLCKVRKDLADQVWMSDLDPFYDNSRLPNFIAWVGEHWE